MTKVYSGIPPPNEKLQISDDQGLLQNTPPPPQWKTSDLRWPKFTPEYPPSMKNFRFQMTKVYSRISPPPKWKTSDFRWPKFTPEYPPPNEKLQIWDDQSLLWNAPPWKTSDLRWPKFTPEYPPPHPPPKWKTSDLRWPTFTPEFPPPPLESGRLYVETNLYPPWIPLVY